MKINVQINRQENAEYYNCKLGDIIEVDFEFYVSAVVASEIGNSSLEACKAQAIAARTYALYRGVGSGKSISDLSTTAQAFRANRYDATHYCNALLGATLTEGQILVYNKKPICAVYSSCNGGQTVSYKEHWGSNIPYLISQPDEWTAATGKEKKGHGVGMSQVGAIEAAKRGIGYNKILQFYYPNTQLYKDYGQAIGQLQQIQNYLIEINKKIEGF